MRQFQAVLLLVSFSLSLIGPVVSADSESQLPACCRRNGKHHCGMKQADDELSSGRPINAIKRTCPDFPSGPSGPSGSKAPLLHRDDTIELSVLSHPAGHVQTEARYRISFSRSSQKRGPPLHC
jgi:hypothetical protein